VVSDRRQRSVHTHYPCGVFLPILMDCHPVVGACFSCLTWSLAVSDPGCLHAATAAQTLSLMGPGVCPSDAALEAAAGHQLGWQLEAAAACLAALHLGQACAGATEGRLWEAALAALQRGLGGCTAPSQPTEPAPGFCLPALHLLAQAGATMAASLGPGEQQAAADLLLAAVQHPPLQVAAARVAAHLTRLEQPPQVKGGGAWSPPGAVWKVSAHLPL
jgi:hypothetical protein